MKAQLNRLPIFIVLFSIYRISFAQEYFEVEPTFNCNCGQFTQDLSELKSYTIEEVTQLVSNITDESGMEFRYPQGGCQQRAQMMHQIIEGLGVEHAKVWLFAPIDLEQGSSIQLELKDKNGLAPDSTIKWGYHVAPCILQLNSNNAIDTLVIDPSIASGGKMLLRDWLKSIKNSDVSKYTFLEAKYYFFNTQNNGNSPVINGYFYTYEPVPGWVTMYDNATVERELAVNDVAMFLKDKLDAGYSDSNSEIRTLLGSVENLLSLFSAQQRFNQFSGITMRSLLQNHPQLINEAMSFYHQRVQFWMNK